MPDVAGQHDEPVVGSGRPDQHIRRVRRVTDRFCAIGESTRQERDVVAERQNARGEGAPDRDEPNGETIGSLPRCGPTEFRDATGQLSQRDHR